MNETTDAVRQALRSFLLNELEIDRRVLPEHPEVFLELLAGQGFVVVPKEEASDIGISVEDAMVIGTVFQGRVPYGPLDSAENKEQ